MQSTFDEFWNELQRYLDEITTPMNECRHGDTMYLPIAISIRDLRDNVMECPEKQFPNDTVPALSEEWLWLQFWS